MTQSNSSNSIAQLERLVGGEWHYKTGSIDDPPLNYHVYKKGLGGALIDSRSYSNRETPPKEVSHGIWFWHPGEGVIKAVGVTKFDTDANVYEYTKIEVVGNKMMCELRSSSAGETAEFTEEWEFPDDDHYLWKLHSHTADGNQLVMEAEFERRNNNPELTLENRV